MTNKDFVVEAVKRLIPDTSWHGETNHDKNSLENLDIGEEILYIVFEELIEEFIKNWKKKKNYDRIDVREALKRFLENYNINIDFRTFNNKQIINDVYKKLGL